MLESPLPFSDGKITGYEGLSLIVQRTNGQNTKFQPFEEAMAERNAALLGGYNTTSPAYFTIGKFTLATFPAECSEAAEYVKQSDVPGFVRAALHLSPENPVNGNEIEQLMSLYNDMFYKGRPMPANSTAAHC